MSHAEHRCVGGEGHALYAGVLSGHLLRAVAGVIHEWVLSACHGGVGLQESAAGDRRSRHVEPAFHESRLSRCTREQDISHGRARRYRAGGHGADDAASWNERYNSPGPEWRAPGKGETLQGNPDGKRPVVGGNTFVVVEADGDDLVHSDGKTAVKAAELIGKFAKQDKPFFLGVGFVRPHVPFVAPQKYLSLIHI